MLTAERRQAILSRLQSDGKVVAAELSGELNVSQDTIRRDLRELADAGLLRRVHGGALPPTTTALTYRARERQWPEAKDQVARRAAGLLRSGQVVVMDAGTTTLQVARHLPHDLRATVITNSPPIALALAEHPAVDVTLIGGQLDKDSLATGGGAALEGLRAVRADVCVLGVCSLHPEFGVTVLDAEDVHRKRAMVAGAAEVVAVATAEKLGTTAPFLVCPLEDITHLVTDRTVEDAALEPYRRHGIEVFRA